MHLSPEAREARKKAQRARVGAKGREDYPELYALQPLQKKKAAANAIERKAYHEEKMRLSREAESEAAGAEELFAKAGRMTTVTDEGAES